MTPRDRTTALRAGLLCIRVAKALEDCNPKRAHAYYRAAWDFFATWGDA